MEKARQGFLYLFYQEISIKAQAWPIENP